MRPGGEEQTRLTNNAWADWDPAYAPDNSRIVFAAYQFADNLDLYTMNIDGTLTNRITIAEGEDKHPSWKVSR